MPLPSNEEFRRTVQRVVDLATVVATEEEQQFPDGVDLAKDYERVLDNTFNPSPAVVEFRSCLEQLSMLELLALQILMYMGRDRDPENPQIEGVLEDYYAFAQEPEAEERACEKLMEKTPDLAEYLRKGQVVADAWGLTFEQLFKAALTSTTPTGQA